MRIIKSITTTDAILTSSNLVDEDPAWVSGGSYSATTRVTYQNKIYECVITHTGKTTKPDLDVTNWALSGYANTYRMFDNVLSSQSTRMENITITLTPSQVVDSIVLLNVNAASVRVVMNDPVDGVVYDETQLLSGFNSIIDYYSYFFASVGEKKTTAIFMNMPSYPTATITVTIDSGTSLAECGEIIYGKSYVIGRTNYGTSVGIKSYSRKETDEFGNITVTKRKNSKFAEYDIDIDNYMLSDVQRFFSDIDSIPAVFIGNPEMEELVVFGFYSDFKATISFPTVSKCTLRVEGLV